MDKTKIENVEVEGINMRDWPDLCDAFIASADYDGKPMTDEQLNEINADYAFVHEHASDACCFDPT